MPEPLVKREIAKKVKNVRLYGNMGGVAYFTTWYRSHKSNKIRDAGMDRTAAGLDPFECASSRSYRMRYS